MITRRSGFRSDERAVSVPLGTVLVFGILMLGMISLQTAYFPSENQEAEMESHQQVMEDFSDLLDSTYETSADGNPRTTGFHIGVNYPTQFTQPFTNPSVISTGGDEPISFSNVASESPMLDGKTATSVEYNSTRFTFDPDYWEWRDASTIGLEHGVIYTHHPANDATIVHNSPTFIKDNQITVVLLEGDIKTGQRDIVTTTLQSEDTYNETVVTNTDGANFKMTLKTNIPEDEWREMLWNEMTEQGGYVDTIQYRTNTDAPNEMTLVFQQDVNYTLRISRVSIATTR